MGVKIFPSRPFKKIIGVSLPNTSETFCVFLQKTLRNRHPKFAGCVVLDVLVVQPGCQNSIILIADKVPMFLTLYCNQLLNFENEINGPMFLLRRFYDNYGLFI